MSEEESQVFRSDEHVEVAAAEGHARKKVRAAKGPSDQRAVKDQEADLRIQDRCVMAAVTPRSGKCTTLRAVPQ